MNPSAAYARWRARAEPPARLLLLEHEQIEYLLLCTRIPWGAMIGAAVGVAAVLRSLHLGAGGWVALFIVVIGASFAISAPQTRAVCLTDERLLLLKTDVRSRPTEIDRTISRADVVVRKVGHGTMARVTMEGAGQHIELSVMQGSAALLDDFARAVNEDPRRRPPLPPPPSPSQRSS